MPAREPQNLTRRQRETLEALQRFQQEHQCPPTRAELGALLNVSAQTADFHLRALERKGYVQVSRQARGLSFVPSARDEDDSEALGMRMIPLLGRVAAGQPVLAVEHLEGRVPLPAGSTADFALRVQGDSMIEAGIVDGDMVLVRQGRAAQSGEIVVAMLGEGAEAEATVKYYEPHRSRVVLRPANAAMDDLVIRPDEAFLLIGTVVGVLRLWG